MQEDYKNVLRNLSPKHLKDMLSLIENSESVILAKLKYTPLTLESAGYAVTISNQMELTALTDSINELLNLECA